MKKAQLNYQEIQERIIAYRKARKLKSYELANKIGTSHQTISNIETGARKPSIEMLYRIADGLECPVYALLPAALQNQGSNTKNTFLSDELTELLNGISGYKKDMIINFTLWAIEQPDPNESYKK